MTTVPTSPYRTSDKDIVHTPTEKELLLKQPSKQVKLSIYITNAFEMSAMIAILLLLSAIVLLFISKFWHALLFWAGVGFGVTEFLLLIPAVMFFRKAVNVCKTLENNELKDEARILEDLIYKREVLESFLVRKSKKASTHV